MLPHNVEKKLEKEAATKEKRSNLSAMKARRRQEIIASREQAKAAKIAERPWLNPALTPGERYRLRYSMDMNFRRSESIRVMSRPKWRLRNIADFVRKAVIERKPLPKYEAFLGFTIAQLRDHLEARFTRGMTWEAFARGDIHIDHIKPISMFDLSTENGVKACWALDNLQPLWAEENLAKGIRPTVPEGRVVTH